MRRGMNLEEAMEILDVVQGEDKAKIRKKYRSLMRRHHPDALGSDRPEQIRRVQQMNEAYHLLMKQEVPILRSARKKAEMGMDGAQSMRMPSANEMSTCITVWMWKGSLCIIRRPGGSICGTRRKKNSVCFL